MAGTVVDWRQALESIDHPLAEQLYEDVDPYKTLEGLGMPTPLYVSFDSVNDFMSNPQEALDGMSSQGVKKFYVGLRPTQPDLKKYRNVGLAVDDVVPYINSVVEPDNRDNYALRVAENAAAIYGGTMIINNSGLVHIEIVKGERLALGTGSVSPEFTARTDQHTGIMKYDFDDTGLKHLVWRAVSLVPSMGENESGLGQKRLRGYYEFCIVDRNGQRPVFYEYNDSPINRVPEQKLFNGVELSTD